jgi:tetratricopeptide (TPR) repeat protein
VSVAAQEERTERAHIHLKAAIAYYDEGRYEDAAREIEASYQLKPLPDLQYNLAQCYERLGRFVDASKAYETYLSGNPNAADRKQVEARIVNLHEHAAAVAAGQTPQPLQEKVVFKTVVVYRQTPPPPGRAARWAAYGIGVLGLGALATGIAFAVLTSQAAQTVATSGDPNNPPPFDGKPRSVQDSGLTYPIVSGVSFGVAGLAAVGAITLFLMGRKVDREAPKFTLAPSLAPHHSGLVAAVRF